MELVYVKHGAARKCAECGDRIPGDTGRYVEKGDTTACEIRYERALCVKCTPEGFYKVAPDESSRIVAPKVYLAGSMWGIPYFNAPLFEYGARWLRDRGYEVFSPLENDQANGLNHYDFPDGQFTGMTPEEIDSFMRTEWAWNCARICESDAIAILPVERITNGTHLEMALAKELKLRAIFIPPKGQADE